MAYTAISGIAPQYENYPNWWLKAYEQGTTTPLAMGLDPAGSTTVAKLELDLSGFINTDGNARVVPYVDAAYDMWLIPTEAEADANDLTNAIQVADNITLGDIISNTADIATNTADIATNTADIATNTADIAGKADLSGAAFTGGISSVTTSTSLADAGATLTAVQLIGGEFTITPTAARTLTTDTAANIIAALSGSVDNSSFEFTVVSLAPFDVTVVGGAGVTLVGNMVVNDGSANFRVRRLTSSTISVTRTETGETNKRGVCTAWVNFDGSTNPPTIRDSYNVADVVDLSTGRYSIVFDQPMDSAGYSLSGSAGGLSSGNPRDLGVDPRILAVDQATVFAVYNLSTTPINPIIFCVQIFGGKS